MRKAQIIDAVENTDLLKDVDASGLAKKAKLGWLYTVMFKIVWPKVKPFLLEHINPKIVDLIDNVINAFD